MGLRTTGDVMDGRNGGFLEGLARPNERQDARPYGAFRVAYWFSGSLAMVAFVPSNLVIVILKGSL